MFRKAIFAELHAAAQCASVEFRSLFHLQEKYYYATCINAPGPR
jgi:hypothetical protein